MHFGVKVNVFIYMFPYSWFKIPPIKCARTYAQNTARRVIHQLHHRQIFSLFSAPKRLKGLVSKVAAAHSAFALGCARHVVLWLRPKPHPYPLYSALLFGVRHFVVESQIPLPTLGSVLLGAPRRMRSTASWPYNNPLQPTTASKTGHWSRNSAAVPQHHDG